MVLKNILLCGSSTGSSGMAAFLRAVTIVRVIFSSGAPFPGSLFTEANAELSFGGVLPSNYFALST